MAGLFAGLRWAACTSPADAGNNGPVSGAGLRHDAHGRVVVQSVLVELCADHEAVGILEIRVELLEEGHGHAEAHRDGRPRVSILQAVRVPQVYKLLDV